MLIQPHLNKVSVIFNDFASNESNLLNPDQLIGRMQINLCVS